MLELQNTLPLAHGGKMLAVDPGFPWNSHLSPRLWPAFLLLVLPYVPLMAKSGGNLLELEPHALEPRQSLARILTPQDRLSGRLEHRSKSSPSQSHSPY